MGYLPEYTKLGYFSTGITTQMTNKSWDEDRENLRLLLRELRKDETGMTQVELSVALGKPQSYVSKYENGERKLDYVEIVEICKALGISMERFNHLFEKRLKRK